MDVIIQNDPRPTSSNDTDSRPIPLIPTIPLMDVAIQKDPRPTYSNGTDSRPPTLNVNGMAEEKRTDNETELLIVIDSNGTHLDRRKFWTLDKTKWVRCGNINEAARAINDTNYTNLKHVLVSVGVNDIDDYKGVEVASRMWELINTAHRLYPDAKITLNELTPRNDNLDGEVMESNKVFLNFDRDNQYVFLAKQSNLRDETYSFFHDEKHVKREKIGRYAHNLKVALRKAYGMPDPRRTNYGHRSASQRHNSMQPSYQNNNWKYNGAGHYSNTNYRRFDQRPDCNFFPQRTDLFHPQSPNERLRKDTEAAWKMEFKQKLIALFD